MDQIRPNIWIGGAEGRDVVEDLKAKGITAVLNVACDINSRGDIPPEDLRQIKIGLADHSLNQPYMKEIAVYTLKMMLLHGEIVLVHCAAGMSRSVWVVCKALSDLEGVDPKHILEEVQAKRPVATYGPLFV